MCLLIAPVPGGFSLALCPRIAVAVKVDVVHWQSSSVALAHRIVVWRSVQHRDTQSHGLPHALAHSERLGDELVFASTVDHGNQDPHTDTCSLHVDDA